MEPECLKRYLEKINLANKRISQAKEWIGFNKSDEKTRLAFYKAVQEVAEAFMDIIAMIIKDESLSIGSSPIYIYIRT